MKTTTWVQAQQARRTATAEILFIHAPTDFEWVCRCGADTPSRHLWAQHVADMLHP